ncbi:KR domain-containing protein [Streptomyces sp. NPDC060065]|uniref:KR domain-containing protein n=1 Tax=Streptomyces sp. NPDC060065 TaxID=3347050 RepID=UPI0036826BCB
MPSLDGAVVLVTGANGGIGTHFVHDALARGAAKVYATARSPRAWDDERVRREALVDRVEVRDLHQLAVAAVELKLRAA